GYGAVANHRQTGVDIVKPSPVIAPHLGNRGVSTVVPGNQNVEQAVMVVIAQSDRTARDAGQSCVEDKSIARIAPDLCRWVASGWSCRSHNHHVHQAVVVEI